MVSMKEQRANIKFCYKLKKTATETFNLIKIAYGKKAMSRKNVFKWFARFRNGRESIADDKRPGPMLTSRTAKNVNKVIEVLEQNPAASMRKIHDMTGIPKSTIHLIIKKNLSGQKICLPMDMKSRKKVKIKTDENISKN